MDLHFQQFDRLELSLKVWT